MKKKSVSKSGRAKLIIANNELVVQNKLKAKRADELIIANKLKGKKAAELVIANKELIVQNKLKDKNAAELVIANKELIVQKEINSMTKSIYRFSEKIITTMQIPSLILDKELRIVAINKSFYSTFKVKHKDSINNLLPNLEEGEWNIPDLIQLLKEVVDQNKIINNFKIEHEFKHIGKKQMMINVRKLKLSIKSEKEKEMILIAFNDITEKVKIYSALEKANKLKDLFIDIMRHDLLNPVGVIRTYVQLALSYETKASQKEILNNANNGCNKLIDRINSASLLSKLEGGGDKLKLTKINLKKVVDNVFKETYHLAQENNIKLVFKIKTGDFIKADFLIQDVFFNLVTNAIKYSPKGTKVIVNVLKKGDKYLISVADQGRGIPNKYKKSIFERFVRLEKGAIKGSGLGLAIVKKIVEVHKGKVWVKDNKPKGSIFIVEL